MGVDMETSRARWEEAVDMITKALETGYAEYDGVHYQQPRAQIVPFSHRPLTERLTEIAMSPESTKMAAELGLAMATFVQKPIEDHKPLLDLYRDTFVATHGVSGPPPTISDAIYCSADADEAHEMHYKHARRYFAELMRHYEFAGTHFTGTKGYESYAEGAAMLREAGMEAAADGYAEANIYGTPEQILQKIEDRINLIGDFHLNAFFTYGGVPHDRAEAGMRLFAAEVIPEVVRLREKCRQVA
jgi:alkanesulfonate monooxygenase SsuD/methylene tetrahydromethanopterin reductase-like flavin-dependent oxidoreductase (luciferase family)